MALLLTLGGFIIVYAIMLTMAWIIASQSLYLNHAKVKRREDLIQNFHAELKPPVQYIVSRYLAQGRKKKRFKGLAIRIFRWVMAIIYLAFLFNFMTEIPIYLQTEQILNSALMLLIIILSIWHFIAAWQFGQSMVRQKAAKS